MLCINFCWKCINIIKSSLKNVLQYYIKSEYLVLRDMYIFTKKYLKIIFVPHKNKLIIWA